MKKITVLFLLFATLHLSAQVISYEGSALLFSQENIKGTARFTGMSGAFGALGGNISAGDINPAGLAVFKNSEATLTLDHNSIDTAADFYNTSTNSSEENFNLSQAGTVLVWRNHGPLWNKFAIGINFTVVNDFDNRYFTTGVSPLTEFNQDPFLNNDADNTNDVFYENVDSQSFDNFTSGSNDKVSFVLAGQYDSKTSYGLSINSYNIDYLQQIIFNESSNDGNNNTLQARVGQELLVNGDGINFNVGFITKLSPQFRVGLAYQSPTWYNIVEEFRENININLSNTSDVYTADSGINVFDYDLRTPSRLTASAAYIFNKKGLISFDYVYRDFQNTKLNPSNQFTAENNSIDNSLQGTSSIRIGGEYRHKNISFRAGYHTDENPVKSINTSTDGYSLGLGVKLFDYVKLDFAYDQTEAQGNYEFLNFVDPATVDTRNSRFTTTLTIGI